MAQLSEMSVAGLEVARLRQLAKSLASKRIKDKSGLQLVCQDREFYAHKLVLESASPYFEAMFNSDLEEAKLGKVAFDQMDPETLEAILDFIYFGKVQLVMSEDGLKKIVAISHLMQLDKLFKYCCNVLANTLTVDNFFAFFLLNQKYESDVLTMKLEKFLVSHGTKLVDTKDILGLSDTELGELVNFLKCRDLNLDVLIGGVVVWIYHDLENRETFSGHLFKCFDGKLLSKERVTLLLQDQKVMNSALIARELKELSVLRIKTLMSGTDVWLENVSAVKQCLPWTTMLTFVWTSDLDDFGQNLAPQCQSIWVQQLDLCNMTWLSPRKTDLIINDTSFEICQYKHRLHFLKNDGDVSFDLHNNSFVSGRSYELPKPFKACYFKQHFYRFATQKCIVRVFSRREDCEEWSERSSLQSCGEIKSILTSADHIYIIANHPSDFYITYFYCNFNPAYDSAWHESTLYVSSLGSELFVLNCCLNMLTFNSSGHDGKQTALNHDKRTFDDVRNFSWPNTERTDLCVSLFQNPSCPFVFFSSKEEPYLPKYYWKPGTGEWKKLPAPQGKHAFTEWKVVYSLEN